MHPFLQAHLHHQRLIVLWLWGDILYDELCLLANFLVAAIDDYVDVVAHSHYCAVVALVQFFAPEELKVVVRILSQVARRLHIFPQLEESGVAVWILQVFDYADAFDADTTVLDILALH